MRVIVLLLLISCGKVEMKVSKIDPIALGPDFEKAIQVCDTRYGKGTLEAEQCFKDYRTYYSPKVAIDPGSVAQYCKTAYTNPIDIQNCETNLSNLVK